MELLSLLVIFSLLATGAHSELHVGYVCRPGPRLHSNCSEPFLCKAPNDSLGNQLQVRHIFNLSAPSSRVFESQVPFKCRPEGLDEEAIARNEEAHWSKQVCELRRFIYEMRKKLFKINQRLDDLREINKFDGNCDQCRRVEVWDKISSLMKRYHPASLKKKTKNHAEPEIKNENKEKRKHGKLSKLRIYTKKLLRFHSNKKFREERNNKLLQQGKTQEVAKLIEKDKAYLNDISERYLHGNFDEEDYYDEIDVEKKDDRNKTASGYETSKSIKNIGGKRRKTKIQVYAAKVLQFHNQRKERERRYNNLAKQGKTKELLEVMLKDKAYLDGLAQQLFNGTFNEDDYYEDIDNERKDTMFQAGREVNLEKKYQPRAVAEVNNLIMDVANTDTAQFTEKPSDYYDDYNIQENAEDAQVTLRRKKTKQQIYVEKLNDLNKLRKRHLAELERKLRDHERKEKLEEKKYQQELNSFKIEKIVNEARRLRAFNQEINFEREKEQRQEENALGQLVNTYLKGHFEKEEYYYDDESEEG